jgi:DNA-binding transcriptional LysR family regulator
MAIDSINLLLMSINQINPLRYAVAVGEHGSFSAAARACGVSQPTVSGAIVDLEEQLGVRLFVRSTRRVEVTPAGKRLLAPMSAVLVALEDVERAVQGLVKPLAPELRLGFTPLMGAARMGVLMEPFRRAEPQVRVVFQEAGIIELENRLEAGAFDVIFGVGLREHRSRNRAVLFSDRLCYVQPDRMKPGSGSAAISEVAQDVLLLTADLCGLAGATRALLAAANLQVNEYPGKAMHYPALEDWVDLGIGSAIIPEPHLRSMRNARPLIDSQGKAIRLPCEAVWRKDLLISTHGKRFATYLQRVVPGVAKGLAH